MTIPSILIGLTINYVLFGQDAFNDAVLGVVLLGLASLFFSLLHWIGYGDWKLLMAFGAIMGLWYSLGVLFFASLLIFIYTLFQIIRQRSKNMQIPFGIFLFLAFIGYEIGWYFFGG